MGLAKLIIAQLAVEWTSFSSLVYTFELICVLSAGDISRVRYIEPPFSTLGVRVGDILIYSNITVNNIVCQEKTQDSNRCRMEISFDYRDIGVQAEVGTWNLIYNTHFRAKINAVNCSDCCTIGLNIGSLLVLDVSK